MILTTSAHFDSNGNTWIRVYTGSHKRPVFRMQLDAADSHHTGHGKAAAAYYKLRLGDASAVIDHHMHALPDACNHDYYHEINVRCYVEDK